MRLRVPLIPAAHRPWINGAPYSDPRIRNRDSLMAPLSRRLIHAALSVGLSLLAVIAMAFAGAVVADAQRHVRPAAQEPTDLPTNRLSSSGAIVVAVVLGSSGTVGSDVLAPYEVFASSPDFSVYTSRRGPSLPPSTGPKPEGWTGVGYEPLVPPGCAQAEPPPGPMDGRPAIRSGRQDHHHGRCNLRHPRRPESLGGPGRHGRSRASRSADELPGVAGGGGSPDT